jgi:hypothetical protein
VLKRATFLAYAATSWSMTQSRTLLDLHTCLYENISQGLPDYSSTTAHALALERCLITSLNPLNLSDAPQRLNVIIRNYSSTCWHKHYGHVQTVSGTVQLQDLQKVLLDFFFYNYGTQPSFSNWIVSPVYRKVFSGSLERKSALHPLITKDLGSVSLKDESKRSTNQRNDSEVALNIMLIDVLFCEKSDKENLGPALSLTMREGNDAAKRMLLGKGANIKEQDEHGKTAPSYAIELGNDELFNEILELRAHLDNKDSSGISDLCRASGVGNIVAVRLLLEHSVPVDFRNADASTPLMAAATHGQTAVCVITTREGCECEHHPV